MVQELDSLTVELPAEPPLVAPAGPPGPGGGRTGDPRSDVELLRDSRGDAVAFRVFYDRWSESVLAYFQRRVGEPQLALDLTAETFATVFEKRTSFRWRGSSPGAWVFGIAKNVLRRYFRTQAIQRRAIDRLGVQLPAYDDLALRRVEELVDNADVRRLVQDALADAKESDRRVLELRFVEGRPFDEIAEALGCTVNAARVRCHRAVTRLERRLRTADHPSTSDPGA